MCTPRYIQNEEKDTRFNVFVHARNRGRENARTQPEARLG